MKTGLTSFSTACFQKNIARKIGVDCGAGEEGKMAESEVKELEVKERKRKPNFSPLEISDSLRPRNKRQVEEPPLNSQKEISVITSTIQRFVQWPPLQLYEPG